MLIQPKDINFQRFAAALLSVLILAGCAIDSTGGRKNSQISFLDGSSSMRVEVEVYKGPLSKELEVQWSELQALMEDTERVLQILHANMTVSALRLGCVNTPKSCDQSNKLRNCSSPSKTIDNQPNKARVLGDEKDSISDKDVQEKKCNVGKNNNCEKDKKIKTELQYDTAVIQLPSNLASYGLLVPKEDINEKDRYEFCNTLGQMMIDIRELNKGLPPVFDASPIEGSKAKKLHSSCLDSNLDEQCPIIENCASNSKKANQECLNELQKYAKVGARLEQRALYWASENVAIMPDSTRLRIEMAHFSQFAKEYGSEIIARTDALTKQLSKRINGNRLPNSVFLRDSSPTAYLNLYQWNEAAVERDIASREDRTRMVEQLVADTYWSKINTVFAAGQGDVSMALVKDDIGNWQLKSFDNSPGELLQAYRSLGLDALKSAKKFVTEENLLGANSALAAANNIALGSTSGALNPLSSNQLSTLRIDTARHIVKTGNQMLKQKEILDERINTKTAEINKCKETSTTSDNNEPTNCELEKLRLDLKIAENDLDSFLKDAVDQINQKLNLLQSFFEMHIPSGVAQ